MDSSQLMMASGGMIAMVISLLTLLLPLIMLILLWKISKATSSTANQLERLIAQVDQLVQRSAATSPATSRESRLQASAPKATRSDSYDLLAAGAAAAAPATEAEQGGFDESFAIDSPADEPAASATATPVDDEDTGFEFPVDDDVFDELAPADDEPAGFSPAEESPDTEEDDFDFPLEEELPAAADEGLANDFGLDETPDDAEEELSAEEEAAALGGAFDTAPAAQAEEEFPEASTEQESFDGAPAPAIVKLEDDPARPEVSMARCGKCDHKLAYKKSLAGRKARCPSCKEAFILP